MEGKARLTLLEGALTDHCPGRRTPACRSPAGPRSVAIMQAPTARRIAAAALGRRRGVRTRRLHLGTTTRPDTTGARDRGAAGHGLVDSTVAVSVTGLPPGARTTVTASARDAQGIVWSSAARFVASHTGTLSLATSSSTGGSYTGREPMGLFDLMVPHSSAATDTVFVSPSTGYAVTLTATAPGARPRVRHGAPRLALRRRRRDAVPAGRPRTSTASSTSRATPVAASRPCWSSAGPRAGCPSS